MCNSFLSAETGGHMLTYAAGRPGLEPVQVLFAISFQLVRAVPPMKSQQPSKARWLPEGVGTGQARMPSLCLGDRMGAQHHCLDKPRGKRDYWSALCTTPVLHLPRNLPTNYQQIIEKEQVDFSEEFLGAKCSRCLWTIHLLQFPLFQQPAGVRDDGHRLEVRKSWSRLEEQQKPLGLCGQDVKATGDAEGRVGAPVTTPCTAEGRAELHREGRVLCHPHHSPAQTSAKGAAGAWEWTDAQGWQCWSAKDWI